MTNSKMGHVSAIWYLKTDLFYCCCTYICIDCCLRLHSEIKWFDM